MRFNIIFNSCSEKVLQVGMMKKGTLKNILLSLAICFGFAVIGGLLTGDALENWFVEIKHPWFSLPLWGWYIVAGTYSLIAIVLLSRLFGTRRSKQRNTALGLTFAMLAANEFWNYLFMGMESTLAGFLALIPFTFIVISLFYTLRKFDRIAAWVLFPYLLWLAYDLIWTYNLWVLNK